LIVFLALAALMLLLFAGGQPFQALLGTMVVFVGVARLAIRRLTGTTVRRRGRWTAQGGVPRPCGARIYFASSAATPSASFAAFS